MLVARRRIKNEFKAISQSVFKLLHEKAAHLLVFLYKLKKISITQIRSRAKRLSSRLHCSIASIYQLDAAQTSGSVRIVRSCFLDITSILSLLSLLFSVYQCYQEQDLVA